MNAILRLISQIVAFGDPNSGQSQKLRFVDWTRDFFDIPVKNPKVESYIIPPNEEKTILSGARDIQIGQDTYLDLKKVTGTTDKYRISWASGTRPTFRAKRNLGLVGAKISVRYNSNAVVSLSVDDNDGFHGIEEGDTIWIPKDGTSPFNAANQGFWTVLSATESTLEVIDYNGAHGLTEANISITSNDQFQAFSSEGVQPGDSLQVFGGFGKVVRRNFLITDATPTYLEIASSAPLPEQLAIHVAPTDMVVYTYAKNYLRLEANQECVVRINGDQSDSLRVYPWIANDPNKVGTFEKTGPVWTLVVVNRSPAPLSLTLISAE